MVEVTVPNDVWGDAEGEALLDRWLVSEGDRVVAGQPLAEVVVIKTNLEVVAPAGRNRPPPGAGPGHIRARSGTRADRQGVRTKMRLEGKVAVVTGAGSGIGRAMAIRFAAEGARIVAADRNAERLDEVVATISSMSGSVVSARGNIANQATAEGLIDLAVDTYGRLDILCNNAGVMDYMQGVGEVSDEVWRRVLGINLDGPMFATRRAVQVMLEQGGGSIINTASTAGIQGGAAGVAYTVSKHGLVGLTRNTAWMYAKKGIRCNAICPGGTATNIAESMPSERLDPEGAKRAGEYAALIPAYLKPEDIADLALFLASDESSHINGAVIPADAGWTAA